jgi:adenylate kinase family enzyme
MPFLTQGKTNWKYILIVLILAVIVGGGILRWVNKQEIPLTEISEIKKSEGIVKEGEESTEEEITNRKEECTESEDPSGCYLSLAKELRDPVICEEIEYAMPRTTCYEEILEFLISLKNPQLCKKFPEYSPEKAYTQEIRHRYECYRKIATLLEDPSVCNELETPLFRNSCYIKVAFDLKNPLVCDNLVEIRQEDWPELYFSRRLEYLNSKEVCAQISQEPEPWKVYQNKEYGWEISYPNNFVIEENDDRIVFTSPENVITLTSPEIRLWGGKYYDDFVWIHIDEKLDTEQTLEEWVAKEYGLEEFKEFEMTPEESGWAIDSIKKIIVGENIPAIKIHGWAQAFDYNRRYIKHKNIIIAIENSVFSGSENTSIFHQMLSTFRFLE